MTKEKKGMSGETLYKIFIYVVLITLAVVIIVPVAWVFLASIKQNSEFYGNPWALPAGFYWQNFVEAWNAASMGSYMLNSVLVTALSLVLLLVIALPAAYCLARFRFRGSRFLNTCFMAGLFINVNYIVVPIFLMLRDGDAWLKNLVGNGFLLNNLVVLAVVYASTALPFTMGLLNLMQAQQSSAEYGILYAGLVLVMLPTLILYMCVQKKLTQGMTVGGLKG
ncbi:MAG: carbohydrate ABC transporter permease [Oscillibacter sp.]|nr:carbohydrate ABC transporter permease [Oscillibacter sp.]